MCDDLFDADVPDELIGAKQWHKKERELTREGFRNGLSEGQEVSLQDGFNQGFADAADILFPFAELRGQIRFSLLEEVLTKVHVPLRLIFTPHEKPHLFHKAEKDSNLIHTKGALLSFKFINDQDIEKEKESALQEFVDEVSSYEASVIKSVSQITETVSSTDNMSIQRVGIDADNPGVTAVEDKSASAPGNRDSSDGLPLEKEINFQRTNKLMINKASCAEYQKKLQYFKEKLKTVLS